MDKFAKIQTSLAVFLLGFFLNSCGIATPTATLVSKFQPSQTKASTTTPTPSTTPVPTTYEVATMVAFATMMVNVCPTTTPSLNQNEEIAILTDSQIQREFAGSYSNSDGFGGSVLIINCNKTFLLQEYTDVGRFPLIQGVIKVENGKIIIEEKNENGVNSNRIYIPVRWGSRKYLISENSVDHFCEIIGSTGFYTEPRGEGDFGFFLLRLHDDEIEAKGFPFLPSGKRICN